MIGNRKHCQLYVADEHQSRQILDEIVPSTFGSARSSEKCECFVPQRSQTIEEFKSVQSLKQFWINAFGVGNNNNKTPAAKCVSKNCSLRREKSATINGTVIRRTKVNECCGSNKSKSLSLHRNVSEEVSDRFDSAPSVVQKRLSDNFYKYKTADLVKSNQFCDRSCSMDIINNSVESPIESRTKKFSDFISCENVHSICSDDRFEQKCAKRFTVDDKNAVMLVPNTTTTAPDNSQDSIECTTMNEIRADKKQRDKMTNTTKLSAATGDKIPLSPSCSKSTNSSTNSLCSDSPKKSSHNQTRKCSFRTNSYQYHRKMTSNSSGSTTVAALTHRFNRMVQNDADILEEVKRNKEVIIHRAGGHVFKIKEGDGSVKKKSVRKVDSSDGSPQKSVKKKLSVKRKASVKSAQPVSVKDAIQFFEPSVDTIDENDKLLKRDKPKVPDKSPQVLLRTKEIVTRKNFLNKPKSVPNDLPIEADKPIALDEIEESVENIAVKDVVVDTVNDSLEQIELANSATTLVQSDNVAETNESVHESENADSNETIETAEARVDETLDNQPEKPTKAYKRLYERFKFKSPFVKKTETTNKSTQNLTNDPTKSENQNREVNPTRLDQFSRSEHCLSWEDEKNYQKMARNMKPNKSFLFSNPPTDQTTKVVEAVNPFVLNKTRSMDETKFRTTCLMTQASLDERRFESIIQETDDLLSLAKDNSRIEDDYEIIRHPDDVTDDVVESPQPNVSFVFVENKRNQNPINHTTDEGPDSSSIYQSISEAKSSRPRDVDCDSITSYESFENYESVDESLLAKIKQESGYEICSPPDPPPPRKSDVPNDSSATTPALPVPKRNVNQFNNLQKSDSSSSNYEKIKYDKAPPRPPKSPCLHKSDDRLILSNEPEPDYDENIYDTIKNIDTNSITGYESITPTNGFLRARALRHSDSGSTMSSDQKTNSLYGTVAGRQSITPPSEGGSENSDEWMDISDGEDDKKHKFVV